MLYRLSYALKCLVVNEFSPVTESKNSMMTTDLPFCGLESCLIPVAKPPRIPQATIHSVPPKLTADQRVSARCTPLPSGIRLTHLARSIAIFVMSCKQEDQLDGQLVLGRISTHNCANACLPRARQHWQIVELSRAGSWRRCWS